MTTQILRDRHFRVLPEAWEAFGDACKQLGTDRSAMLRQFVDTVGALDAASTPDQVLRVYADVVASVLARRAAHEDAVARLRVSFPLAPSFSDA